ncbi:prefoldin subunit 6-like [Halichondria panicea]|uniref:prefoldin subunit 6-like n=1 Tax=Halichondria panicea TaxID=6063 RepID=UPI00312BC69F
MATVQSKEKILNDEIMKFKSLQKEVQKCASSKGQLEAQLLENQNVKDELEKVTDGSVVYKLVGPVLLKQDLTEAKVTVQKRLDYIGKEISRYEDVIKDFEKKQDTQAEKLQKMQVDYQQAVAKAAGPNQP